MRLMMVVRLRMIIKKYATAWIKKYILKVQSPSLIWLGYKYEWDYLMAKRGNKK